MIGGYCLMVLYACTILLSAFLLFEVQPLIGKIILPWFGGGASVWSTCLLFFQVSLLAGYLYAHFSTKLLKPPPNPPKPMSRKMESKSAPRKMSSVLYFW